MKRFFVVTMVLLVCFTSSTASCAEPLLEALERQLKHEWLSVGALLQVVADLQPTRNLPGENGFSIANFRVQAGGKLDEGFAYFLQANFISSPALLDAWLSYDATPSLTIGAGAMKAPFSAELLTAASSIDFVNRAQVVNVLSPGRQIGVNARAALGESDLTLTLGVFNGNGVRANGNDGSGILGLARLSFDRAHGEGRAQFGVNGAFGEDDGAPVGTLSSLTGERILFGADMRLEHGRWLGSGEIIWASLDPKNAPSTEPWGYQITFGAMLSDRTQLLARIDALKPGDDWTNFVVAGFNLWPTRATEIQVNALIPTHDEVRHSQWLLNAQVAF